MAGSVCKGQTLRQVVSVCCLSGALRRKSLLDFLQPHASLRKHGNSTQLGPRGGKGNNAKLLAGWFLSQPPANSKETDGEESEGWGCYPGAAAKGRESLLWEGKAIGDLRMCLWGKQRRAGGPGFPLVLSSHGAWDETNSRWKDSHLTYDHILTLAATRH